MRLTITITKDVEDYEEAGAILLHTQQLLESRKGIELAAFVTEPIIVEPAKPETE